jgi:uncharacterized protein (TIGR00369 family)
VRDNEALRRWFNAQDVVAHGYLHCEMIGPGSARVSMGPAPELAAPNGAMNGGHLASLAENASGLAVMTLYAADVWSGTIQMDLKFLEPVMAWPAAAQTRVLRSGKRLAFVECEIFDADGRLCAKGSSINSLTTSTNWRCG